MRAAVAPRGADWYRRFDRPGVIIVCLTAVLAIPIAVALGVLHSPRWFPLLDMAWTELRVRDVASGHPPLIGLPGRIGTTAQQGSHPGPLSFYALWPFYWVSGAKAWSLEVAAGVLNVGAAAAALLIAYRRGGRALVFSVAAILALLMHAYGASLLTQAWNPYIPIMYFIVLAFAAWSVLCDDFAMLPVAVVSGSLCVQTHVSYVALTGALGVVVVGFTVARLLGERRAGGNDAAGVDSGASGGGGPAHVRRWVLISLGLAVLVWLPPIIDQLRNSPGNLRVLADYFTNPPLSPIGLRRGAEAVLIDLNPWRMIASAGESGFAHGSVVPGVLLVTAWAIAAVAAWRRRHALLNRLNLVLGVLLLAGVFSASRIFGFVWYYLLLWVTGVTALLLLSIGWTVLATAHGRLDSPTYARVQRLAAIVCALGLVVIVASATADATRVDVPTPVVSRTLGAVVAPTARALGRNGRTEAPILVTWLPDPFDLGAQGYGFLNELDRLGFDVRADRDDPFVRAGATRHRLVARADADTEVHLAIGSEIAKWRAKPGVEEVAFYEPRTPAQRRTFARLRLRVIRALEDHALDDRVPIVDENLFRLVFDSDVPRSIRANVEQMIDLGLPAAVFIRHVGGETLK